MNKNPMTYIKVLWRHENADMPTEIYSEFNGERWETRKVEIFRNGKFGYACDKANTAETILSIDPLPPLSEITKDDQFDLIEIEQVEFEEVWRKTRGEQS